MIRTANNSKKMPIMLTIALISAVIITSSLTSFLPLNSRVNTNTIINRITKQSSSPTSSLTEINETNTLNATNYNNYSSVPLATMPISLETQKTATIKQPDFTQLFFSFPDNTNPDQITESNVAPPINVENNNETDSLNVADSSSNYSPPITTSPISVDTLNFITYTYGGYSVQQPDPNQFVFSFPDNTNQGQLAGSDALTLDTYTIQKIEFDAVFVAPKISALGFDEMVIFAASDTSTYKGTEFGIRLDLSNGFICGYNQDPNGNCGDVNFQMLNLMPNDGMMHHYTLIMLGTQVLFYIDGINYGSLNFPNNTDYSGLTFYILAVVHRFTDDWDSVGDNMTVKNFLLNQP